MHKSTISCFKNKNISFSNIPKPSKFSMYKAISSNTSWKTQLHYLQENIFDDENCSFRKKVGPNEENVSLFFQFKCAEFE